MEMLEDPDSPESFTTAPDGEGYSYQELRALSQKAMSGTENKASFRLQGVISRSTSAYVRLNLVLLAI